MVHGDGSAPATVAISVPVALEAEASVSSLTDCNSACDLIASNSDSVAVFAEPSVESIVPITPYVTGPRCATHVFKAFVGASTFLLPAYLAKGGYILGPVIMLLTMAMNYDCIMMHIRAQLKIGRADVRDYSQLVGFIFGPRAQNTAGFSIVLLSMCYIVIFFQISAGLMAEVFGSGTYTLTVVISGAVSTCFALFSNDLSKLAWVSGFSMVVGGFLTIATFVSAANTFVTNGAHTTVRAYGSFTSTFSFCSMWSSAIFGIIPLVPICLSMSPENRGGLFPKVLKYMMVGIIVMHLFYGMTGYLAYGSTLTTTTLSMLPPNFYGNLMRCLLAFSLITSIPMSLVPAMLVADLTIGVAVGTAPYKSRPAVALRLVSNAAMVLFALALGADQVVLVSSYAGATLCNIFAYILPVLIELQVELAIATSETDRTSPSYYKSMWTSLMQRPTTERLKLCIYLAFSLIVIIVGLASAVEDTIRVASA
jgi:proton-coupled amino acid transporter